MKKFFGLLLAIFFVFGVLTTVSVKSSIASEQTAIEIAQAPEGTHADPNADPNAVDPNAPAAETTH